MKIVNRLTGGNIRCIFFNSSLNAEAARSNARSENAVLVFVDESFLESSII